MIPENEQWKLEGNCMKCRRKPYCKKCCLACTKKLNQLFLDGFKKYMEQYQKEVEDGDKNNDVSEAENSEANTAAE